MGTISGTMETFFGTFAIGLAAFVWIVLIKIIVAQFPDKIPAAFRNLVAMA